MKMAKASVADLEMAMELVNALESLSSRWGASMPEKIAKPQSDEEDEGFSLDDDENCRRVCDYLIQLTRSASLSRVVMGMVVILDPANALVDPEASTLETHPDTQVAMKDAARLRWLLEDHDTDTRERCREILERLLVMGYGAAVQLIDDAMQATATASAV